MSEVRRAAERLRAFLDCKSIYTEDEMAVDQADKDGKILARAYLAEHAADDDEVVTEEWLHSVGFERDGDRMKRKFVAFVDRAVMSPLGKPTVNPHWRIGMHRLKEKLPTRGHVRRLLRALNIPEAT